MYVGRWFDCSGTGVVYWQCASCSYPNIRHTLPTLPSDTDWRSIIICVARAVVLGHMYAYDRLCSFCPEPQRDRWLLRCYIRSGQAWLGFAQCKQASVDVCWHWSSALSSCSWVHLLAITGTNTFRFLVPVYSSNEHSLGCSSASNFATDANRLGLSSW